MPGILPREYKNRINGCPATTVENFNFFREWDQSVPRPSLGKLWIIELKEIKDTYCYDYEIKVSSDWYTIDVIYSPLVGRHSRRWSWTSREWLLWLTLYTEVTWRDKGVPFHSCIYDPLGENEKTLQYKTLGSINASVTDLVPLYMIDTSETKKKTKL